MNESELPPPHKINTLSDRYLNMPRSEPFEQHHKRYDEWFVRHAAAYHSELLALRSLLPWQGRGLSVGVGTGRFAAPLGVQFGIDPARKALSYAANRGITVAQGVAEALPFADHTFHTLLIVTTLCFVDDASAMLKEAYRVLKPGGVLVIGFIDRSSALGQHYLSHQAENVFYREATFFSASEVQQLLENNGFTEAVWVQTIFQSLDKIREIEAVREGYGEGAFVVVRVNRP